MRVTWEQISHPDSNRNMYGIVSSGSLFCAVGDNDGTDAYIITSPDGITWTERSNTKNTLLLDIVWNGTIFCAVGWSDGTDAYIVTSSNGITWTERSNAKNIILFAVTWSSSLGLFCAVGNNDGSGDTYILTSPDGITWTERTNPKTAGLYDVSWNGTVFCAIGLSDGVDAYILTSTDGITWTERSSTANRFNAIAWSSTLSLFCAVGQSGVCYTSPDGITWTERSVLGTGNYVSITWTGTVFVTGAPNSVMASYDGIVWFQISRSGWYNAGAEKIIWDASTNTFIAVGRTTSTHTLQVGRLWNPFLISLL